MSIVEKLYIFIFNLLVKISSSIAVIRDASCVTKPFRSPANLAGGNSALSKTSKEASVSVSIHWEEIKPPGVNLNIL